MILSELLDKKEFVMLDGGMGTMLQKAGLSLGETPEIFGITEPEKVIGVHRAYVEAGADIIYTCTFGANRYKLEGSGYSVRQVVEAAVKNALIAAAGTDVKVALDIGPIGKLLQPNGTLSFDEAYDIFKEIVLAAQGADLIVTETMTDLHEVKAAILAVKENSRLPLISTMSFEANGRTFTGCTPAAAALTIAGLGADALGINCSLGPKEMYPVVEELSKWTNIPLVVKPNAGLPDPETGEYFLSAAEFAEQMKALVPLGVKLMGGCCGTTPDFIAMLKKSLEEEKCMSGEKVIPPAVCSPSRVVMADTPCIVGERINPTAKKALKEALQKGNIGYALTLALDQIEAGAQVLDVNVGAPEVDEVQAMYEVVRGLQEITDVPLQIDTTNAQALERALRIYNGKPIINSVNGEKKSMKTVLPLAKKYGGAVVALTLDENGIPKTADERFKIARRIVKKAVALGINKQDIYVDCLTLAASAEQENVMNTLEALARVKKELGVRTALGVSNISFGLPNRPLINQTFLAMALMQGLDMAIINPNDPGMAGAIAAYRMLSGADKNSVEYINKYRDYAAPAALAAAGVGPSGAAGFGAAGSAADAGLGGVVGAGATSRGDFAADGAVAGVVVTGVAGQASGGCAPGSGADGGVVEAGLGGVVGAGATSGGDFAADGAVAGVVVTGVAGQASGRCAVGSGADGGAVEAGLGGVVGAGATSGGASGAHTLGYAIEHGLKKEAAAITGELLKNMEPLELVNNLLIPALDKAGVDFEAGRIFLPQLIMAANVAQEAFEVIKKNLSESGAVPESKGKIVLATVKGDVHDIGKNIVKVLLENYGYEIIDLGRDVECAAVVEAAKKHKVKLVGLSALMTTTLKSMEETIALLRKEKLACTVMVGGAVLTPEYAAKIGADFYAHDAKDSIDIAKKILG